MQIMPSSLTPLFTGRVSSRYILKSVPVSVINEFFSDVSGIVI